MGNLCNTLCGLLSEGPSAATSPGYNAAKLSPEKLNALMKLAERAQSTYPQAFVDAPQEGDRSTPEGDRALEKGRWASAHRKPAPRDAGRMGLFNPGFPSPEELDEELGGVDGLYTVFGVHYCRMFVNPRMLVLFDTRSEEDANTSAMDHGRRIVCALMDQIHGTATYATLGRGFSGFFAVTPTHNKAKACPMRPLSQQVPLPKGHPRANARFTTDQRDTWVGNVMCAAEECGTSEAFQTKLGLWLAMQVSVYAPFMKEETHELDWMEETPFR